MTAAWAKYDLAAATPAEARLIAERVRSPWRKGGPQVASIRDDRIGDVRVRIYDPAPNAKKPTLVYLHGGGWVVFSIDTHDRLMREYAARAGVRVVGVDYALAPEAKYPVALEQVVSVIRDLGEVMVGGDSAGGNLALASALRLRDAGENLVRGILLNYAVLDRDSSSVARATLGAAGNMLTADEMDEYWGKYLDDATRAAEPYASPLRADLRGLPRTLLIVPKFDLLAEQSIALADKMRAAGGDVRLKIYPAIHSFLEAMSISSLAREALDDSARWLRGE